MVYLDLPRYVWMDLKTPSARYSCIPIVVIGILLTAATGVLGVICMKNFGRGLKAYVQRGRSKKERQDVEMASKNDTAWQIDED